MECCLFGQIHFPSAICSTAGERRKQVHLRVTIAWAKHPSLRWLRSIELAYLRWLHCQSKLDYHFKYLHVLIASGTLFTDNLMARMGKWKLKLGLVVSDKYLTVHGSFCLQVKQVCSAQAFGEQTRPWFFPNTEVNLHDTWLDVIFTPLHPLPLKNKLKVWNLLSDMTACVKAFSQLLVSPRLHLFPGSVFPEGKRDGYCRLSIIQIIAQTE